MHKLWEEHIPCGTVHSISNVRASVTSKIQKHSNCSTVVEITRGRCSMHMFGKRLSFGRGKLSACGSNIEAKSFQYSFDQTFLRHVKRSSIRITLPEIRQHHSLALNELLQCATEQPIQQYLFCSFKHILPLIHQPLSHHPVMSVRPPPPRPPASAFFCNLPS